MGNGEQTGRRSLNPVLRWVSDSEPGIYRIQRGRRFCYVDQQGRRVLDSPTLERIRGLSIPPAYTQVWICPLANGHLQATGYDVRGRKQYRYHPKWTQQRDLAKFARMVEFGNALRRLRACVKRDLRRPGLPREKLLALAVMLLDRTGVRIGNRRYAQANHSYGLTTLKSGHASFKGNGSLRLDFHGKRGRRRHLEINQRDIAAVLHTVNRLPGQQLLQYRDRQHSIHPVDPRSVNEYISNAAGDGFTAKDFRTWIASVHAVREFCAGGKPPAAGARQRRAVVKNVVRAVSEALGNTPAVCRKSYINPWIFEAWDQGLLSWERSGRARRPHSVSYWERKTLSVLRQQRLPDLPGY